MKLYINNTGHSYQVIDTNGPSFCIEVATYEEAMQLVVTLLRSQALIGE